MTLQDKIKETFDKAATIPTELDATKELVERLTFDMRCIIESLSGQLRDARLEADALRYEASMWRKMRAVARLDGNAAKIVEEIEAQA